jgi:DNA-binding MarR family transcriptional regulator
VDHHSDQILATLRQIIRAIDLHSKSLTKRYGLTGPQLMILKELRRHENLTIGRLAKNVSLSQATVTTILDRLEKLDFLKRIRNTEDKRKVNIQLTRKAEEVIDTDPSLLQEEFIHRFEKLEEWEKTLLLSSLQRIATMMNAEGIRSQPVLDSGPLETNDREFTQYLEESE